VPAPAGNDAVCIADAARALSDFRWGKRKDDAAPAETTETTPERDTTAPAATEESKVKVQIDITGAPPGTIVSTETRGNVAPPDVDLGQYDPLAAF